jgi:hypothetical protein
MMEYGPFTDAGKANACLMELYQKHAKGEAIVARGQVRVGSILPGFAIVVHKVTPRQGDLTPMYGKGDIYSAVFMKTLKDMSGMRTVVSERIDDGARPHFRMWRVRLEGMDLVGRMRSYEGTYELDLSDQSSRAEDIMGKPPKRGESEEQRRARCWKNLCDMRTHITTRAETGAMSRAVVEALSLKRSLNDLKNKLVPIYIPTLDFHAETASEEVRAAMSMGAVQAMLGAWGPPPAPREVPPQEQRFEEEPEPDPEIPYDGPDASDEPRAESEEMPPPPADPTFVSPEQVDRMKAWGCWTHEMLKELGWSGEGKVSVEIFERARAEYGGAG